MGDDVELDDDDSDLINISRFIWVLSLISINHSTGRLFQMKEPNPQNRQGRYSLIF